jgi:cell division protein FtsB
MNLEPEEGADVEEPLTQEAQQWHKQRRFDMRLLKIIGIPAVLCSIGIRFLPEPYNWWALYLGVSLVVVATLIDVCWVGPRQILRIRQIGRAETALLRQLQKEQAGIEDEAEGTRDEDQ